jgi:UPF0755 protein
MLSALRLWLLPVIVVFTILNIGRTYIEQSWNGIGPLPRQTNFVVPHGPTDVVAEALAKAQIIAWPLAFRVAVLVTASDGPLHAGEFTFPANASLHQVLSVLRHGRQVEHHLTIPEGLTARQIAALIDAAPAMTGEVAPPAEGTILPNTYDYLFGASRQALLDRAEHALDTTMAVLWPGRAPGLPLSSPGQAITLASIVERETAKPEERAMVAGVYVNRLRVGMRLQADPTVIYGMTGGSGTLDRPLDHADLRVPDAYNTYLNTGLPPGPIAAPGGAAIEAVLHPADTEALYFVADGSGGHVFSRDYAGQQRNVAKLREQQNAMGDPAVSPASPP